MAWDRKEDSDSLHCMSVTMHWKNMSSSLSGGCCVHSPRVLGQSAVEHPRLAGYPPVTKTIGIQVEVAILTLAQCATP